MSRLKDSIKVKPMAALFSADREKISSAALKLEEKLGPLDYISNEFEFNQTSYYREEMGWPLYKRFLAAERLMDPADLVDLKIWADQVESDFAGGADQRNINIDPGYICAERLVLATGKNFTHRIYLDRGVYADLTLVFEKGGFKSLPWTFPDYASVEVKQMMFDIRQKYMDQIKNETR